MFFSPKSVKLTSGNVKLPQLAKNDEKLPRLFWNYREITVVITTNFQLPQSSKNDEKLLRW
jgi:hypothetical protein